MMTRNEEEKEIIRQSVIRRNILEDISNQSEKNVNISA